MRGRRRSRCGSRARVGLGASSFAANSGSKRKSTALRADLSFVAPPATTVAPLVLRPAGLEGEAVAATTSTATILIVRGGGCCSSRLEGPAPLVLLDHPILVVRADAVVVNYAGVGVGQFGFGVEVRRKPESWRCCAGADVGRLGRLGSFGRRGREILVKFSKHASAGWGGGPLGAGRVCGLAKSARAPSRTCGELGSARAISHPAGFVWRRAILAG